MCLNPLVHTCCLHVALVCTYMLKRRNNVKILFELFLYIKQHSLNDKKKKIFTTNNSLSENSYNRVTLSESFTCVSVLNVLPSIDVTVCNDKEKDYISYLYRLKNVHNSLINNFSEISI